MDREDTREIAARRAYEAVNANTRVSAWSDLPQVLKERWSCAADAVLATLQWETESALVGQIDDLERRVRELEAQCKSPPQRPPRFRGA